MKALKAIIIFVVLVGLGSALVFAQADLPRLEKRSGKPPLGKPFLSGKTLAEIEEAISILPPGMITHLAKMYGLTHVKGKAISGSRASKGGHERAMFADRPVSADDTAWEMNATIAARPNNANIVVAAFENEYNGYCYTSTSLDKGETWSTPKKLPPRVASDYVWNPVIRYSPNSSSLYAVYICQDYYNGMTYLMFSKSTNNGSSWSAPKVVFSPGDYDNDGNIDMLFRPWVDVHYFSTSTANPYLYITCTVGEYDGGASILFRRSTNSGSAFDANWWRSYSSAILLGPRAIGGKAGDVIWVFYWSANWLNTSYPFYIQSNASKDYGKTFVNLFKSSIPLYNQLPYYLGPDGSYGYWWEGMLPSIAMASSGVAYVAYTADPQVGSLTPEDGDIYIIKSPRPYTTWSYPENLTPGREAAQGNPTIRTKKTAGGTVVSVFCEDHASSYADNELYDITVIRTGLAGDWIRARISDVTSLTSWFINNEYLDSAASGVVTDKVIHVIWGDRADKLYFDDYETDVYCDLIELIY
jgi:hypothetical protein